MLLVALAADGWAAESRPLLKLAYNVRDYGAAGDGQTLDTKAIQRAVEACAAAGGGTVFLPAGTFLSGTIYLRDNLTLHLAAGAVLRGSRNIRDYPSTTPKIVYLYRSRFTKSLLYAEGVENICLEGRGMIDGQGEHFPAKRSDDAARPYILRFSQCRNVRVAGLRFRNSARWLSHYLACENVTIEGISIESLIRENRDGIDVDSCSGVRIANCHIRSGDDAIVLKATADRPCRRVTVTNCVLSSMASALKLGTESNGGFQDITITNCTIFDTGSSGIALEMVDGGLFERVNVSNITMKNVEVPIFIRLGNRARPIPTLPPPGMGSMRDITISNVQASGAGGIGCSITGIPGSAVENVTLQNIRLRFRGGGTREQAAADVPEKARAYPSGKMFGSLSAYGFFCRHTTNLRLHNLDLAFEEDDHRPAIVCDDVCDLDLFGLRAEVSASAEAIVRLRDVRGAIVHGCRTPNPVKTFMRLEGEKTADIAVINSDLRNAERILAKDADVPADAVHLQTVP